MKKSEQKKKLKQKRRTVKRNMSVDEQAAYRRKFLSKLSSQARAIAIREFAKLGLHQ